MSKCKKCNDKGWYFVDEWVGTMRCKIRRYTDMEATLTFSTLKMAEDFAKAWSRKSMKGHIIGCGAENVSVMINGITDELKIWIDMYVANINNNEK